MRQHPEEALAKSNLWNIVSSGAMNDQATVCSPGVVLCESAWVDDKSAVDILKID